MIATGNHLRFTIRCALQHATGRVPCKKSEMFDYPSGFLPRQKATSPDKGRHGCGANPGERGRYGGRKEVTGSEKVGAAICRPPTPDHNRRNRAAGSRPYRHPERDVGAPSPTVGSDSFRLFSIIPKGYNHAPGRNSCRRQFMAKPIHARQGNSLAIGRHAAPGRVPCKKTELFDYPSGFLSGQKATSPDKGRHGCAANPGDGGRQQKPGRGVLPGLGFNSLGR